MRIIYKLLIGMLLFNGVYLALSPVFNTADLSAVDPSDIDNVDQYKGMGGLDIGTMLVTGVGTFVGAIVIGAISFGSVSISLGTIIAASTIVGVLAGLWRGASGIFEPMLAMGGSTVSDFYTIFVIVFGIIITLTIAEMFGGQSGVDN